MNAITITSIDIVATDFNEEEGAINLDETFKSFGNLSTTDIDIANELIYSNWFDISNTDVITDESGYLFFDDSVTFYIEKSEYPSVLTRITKFVNSL